MAPKRTRQQNKTVTIYNSKTATNGNGKKEKKGGNVYEQTRNSVENWEFHFKAEELEEVRNVIKCKDLSGVPLMIGASVLNHKELVLNLMKHGYNINEPDKNNMTPLCWAVKLKFLEMVDSLLGNKADPSIKPNNGDDVIFMALGSSFWDEESFMLLWNYLKNAGHCEVNSISKNGLSMLHLAVRREWNILVDVLINCDVNINVSNPNGVTPLMLASYRNEYCIASRLISKGASVKKRNSDGFTALCYAFSAAITKCLSPPFLLIDKLRGELAKNNIYLIDYVKDRLRIIATPSKNTNTIDQPSAEQMLQHIFSFVLCNTQEGFDIVLGELNVLQLIKEAMEKYMDNKEQVKLCLITLVAIMRNLPFSPKFLERELSIEDALITSGCYDVCISACKRYNDDNNVIFLAHSTIIFSRFLQENANKWLESHQDDLYKYNEKYLENLATVDLPFFDYDMFQEKALDLRAKLALKFNVVTIEDTDSGVSNVEKVDEHKTSSYSKRNKRRSKLLKMKPNSRKKVEEKRQLEENEDDNACVNAIKSAIVLLQEDHGTRKQEAAKLAASYYTNDWKSTILNFPFKNRINLIVPEEYDVDVSIRYLENLLGLIVNKYKAIWELECPFEDSDNDDANVPNMEIEYLQNEEKDNLLILHREFYNLTGNVRRMYGVDPCGCEKVLKDLEKLLLNHGVRGETVLEEITAMEAVKVSANVPVDCELDLGKYMEDVLNERAPEKSDVSIEILEHLTAAKKPDHNSMGDYVYLNEIAGLLMKRCECTSTTSSKHDYYHLTSSILNICEDGEDVTGTGCCNKGCVKELSKSEHDDSRWCSLMRSLEMMEDSQIFFGGKIRISNPEKRKNHELSPSGNFGPLEIGLGVDKLPLAVRFVPKNDICAPLLKSQIDPILELKHRNILHFYLCACDVNFLVIATPLCEYNLGEYVHKIKQTQMKVCKVDIIRQILTGLMFLHDCDEPIVHGSLKPSNVLVDVYGNLKLAEFGIHKALSTFKNLPESTIIWFATESYRQYKQKKSVECTCASDIQVAGMLVHFAANFGGHAFGNEVMEILKNLEKATPQIYSKDMELYDLLTWMLMGEPSERPTIHQVLSHIYFWSNAKKWTYILACAGLSQKTNISLDVETLHTSLDKIALKENIIGNCWILTAKKHYPQAAFVDCKDTPSGLLKFIKYVKDNNIVMPEDCRQSISSFILNAFPHFVLSLYRMIENTEWSDHRMFLPFHNVID